MSVSKAAVRAYILRVMTVSLRKEHPPQPRTTCPNQSPAPRGTANSRPRMGNLRVSHRAANRPHSLPTDVRCDTLFRVWGPESTPVLSRRGGRQPVARAGYEDVTSRGSRPWQAREADLPGTLERHRPLAASIRPDWEPHPHGRASTIKRATPGEHETDPVP